MQALAYFARLFSSAASLALHWMGTTFVGVVLSLVLLLAPVLQTWRFGKGERMRQELVSEVLFGVKLLAGFFVIMFVLALGHLVYSNHASLTEKVALLSAPRDIRLFIGGVILNGEPNSEGCAIQVEGTVTNGGTDTALHGWNLIVRIPSKPDLIPSYLPGQIIAELPPSKRPTLGDKLSNTPLLGGTEVSGPLSFVLKRPNLWAVNEAGKLPADTVFVLSVEDKGGRRWAAERTLGDLAAEKLEKRKVK